MPSDGFEKHTQPPPPPPPKKKKKKKKTNKQTNKKNKTKKKNNMYICMEKNGTDAFKGVFSWNYLKFFCFLKNEQGENVIWFRFEHFTLQWCCNGRDI